MTDQTLLGSYAYGPMVLSVLIAILASYTALDLAGRVTASRGRARLVWLVAGATSMGIGIWSMHFVGMLAFSLPVSIQYDWPIVLLSLLAGVFASAVSLFVVSRPKMGALRALSGSVFMGKELLKATGWQPHSVRGLPGRRMAHVHRGAKLYGPSVLGATPAN